MVEMIKIFTENVWANSTQVLISRLLMIQIRHFFFPLIPGTRRSLPLNLFSIGLVFELNEYYYLILFILLLVCVFIYLFFLFLAATFSKVVVIE